MIQLTPMTPDYLEKVVTLSVAQEQLPYVGTIEEVLLNADDKVHPHLVLAEGEVVGIFLIDTTYSDNYDFCPVDGLGFRAFLIDSRQQGKGYGSGTMAELATYLSQHYSGFSTVYLTVNCKNHIAYQCYLKNGFQDDKQLYLGGAAGPQHILSMAL